MTNKKIIQVPMGASQWRGHGKKYNYWKYFEDKIDKKWEKKTIIIPKGSTHPIHDKCEQCFGLARQEFKEMIGEKIKEYVLEGDLAGADVLKDLSELIKKL